MKSLYVVALGPVAVEPLAWIEAACASWFPLEVKRLEGVVPPPEAWDQARQQFRSVDLLKILVAKAPRDAGRILGITEGDLGIPMLTFLFGQAQVDGVAALVSLCRLRQEHYGLPPDDGMLKERAVKEVLHEMGHTFGLTHCGDGGCSMSLSTHIGFVDAKKAEYCAPCGARLAHRFASLEKDRYEHLAYSDRR